MSDSAFLKKVTGFCEQYGMLSPGAPVLVCVSGGTDSMCLLHVLHGLSEELGFPLFAAHYNHNLRGAESDADEAFVREACEKMSVPLFVGSGDVASEARRRGAGVEETARELRYAFFFRIAGENGLSRVATAHNADDDLETVLMRLARGTGLRGLCGIPPVRGRLIRPLLGVSREEIEAYNLENGVPHREDSTNERDDYTRNLLRHRVVPVLRKINPAVSVTEMTALLREDEAYLDGLARKFIEENLSEGGLPAEELRALPRPVRSRVLRRFCGAGLTGAHVAALTELLENGGTVWSLDLPGVTVRREYGSLKLGKAESAAFEPAMIPLDRRGIIDVAGFHVICEIMTAPGTGIYNSLTSFLIKRDKIVGNLKVRPRLPGDRLTLPGRPGGKSLKRLLIDGKIPRHLRDGLPVLSDDEKVLAVYGLGQDVSTLPAVGEPAVKIEIQKTEER